MTAWGIPCTLLHPQKLVLSRALAFKVGHGFDGRRGEASVALSGRCRCRGGRFLLAAVEGAIILDFAPLLRTFVRRLRTCALHIPLARCFEGRVEYYAVNGARARMRERG